MKRKILISFLGTSNYIPCKYSWKNQPSRVVTYIQSAIKELIAPNQDKYLLFCTEEAEKKHFEKLNNENNNVFDKIKIPTGSSEAEIWEIFRIIFDELQENDEVHFDITHSFRHLPMLGITLLQYAKFIKNITVKGIYYGAFENLGYANEIEKKIPNPEDRVAPIFNLTAFSMLQDWSQFGSQFVNTGNASGLSKIANENLSIIGKSKNFTDDTLSPILDNQQRKNGEVASFKKINNSLKEISLDFSTNRGKELLEGDKIEKLKEEIKNTKGNFLPAFTPILNKIQDQLEDFGKGKYRENCFASVRWCLDKDLIQQGITQLQENIVTLLLIHLNTDYFDKDFREILSAYLGYGYKTDKSQWTKPLISDKAASFFQDFEEKLKSIPNFKNISKHYDGFKQIRNDINHNGMIKHAAKANKFKKNLETKINEVEDFFKHITI